LLTKVLIIRFSSIGDIVLCTSFLRQLKHQWKGDLEIHFLTKQKFSGVLNHNPNVSEIHTFEKSIAECYPTLVNQAFDYIFDLQSNLRSALVKRRLKVLSFSLDKRNFAKYIWVRWGIKGSIGHVVDRYRQTASAFNIQEDGVGLEFYLAPGDHFKVEVNHFIAVVLGATHAGKRADAQHWIDWLTDVKLPIILLGGESEVTLAKEISERIACLNLSGELELGQSASVIKQAKMVITGDTGLMHIAAAFKKDIISLWGCTRPSLGMAPWLPGENSVVLEPINRKSVPCSKLGNRCKYGWKKKCMHQLIKTQIAQAIEAIDFAQQKALSTQ